MVQEFYGAGGGRGCVILYCFSFSFFFVLSALFFVNFVFLCHFFILSTFSFLSTFFFYFVNFFVVSFFRQRFFRQLTYLFIFCHLSFVRFFLSTLFCVCVCAN